MYSDNVLLRNVEEDDDVFIYYDDFTFRSEDWKHDDRSFWKIEDGKFHFTHRFDERWICLQDDIHIRLTRLLMDEMATRELEKYL